MAKAEEYRLAQEKCLNWARHVPDENLRRTWLELADSYEILLILDKELAGIGPLIGPDDSLTPAPASCELACIPST